MNSREPDFERFSHRLDEAWLRDRLRRTLPAPLDPAEEETLVRALAEADPLADVPAPGGWRSLREALRSWPVRLAFAGGACALVLLGLALSAAIVRRPDVRLAAGPPPRPGYQPEPGRALGVGARVKEESERRFREAMSHHAAPDFAARAIPLLREAVAADPSNDRAQFWLGVALLLDDRSAEAVRPLEEAVHLAPADLRAKEYLLFAYLRTGAVDRALALQAEIMAHP